MWDCWHTQLRSVSHHFPEARLRALRDTRQMTYGEIFVYVTPAVMVRGTTCPSEVVTAMRDRGYTIIHIQEARQ